MLAAGTTMQAPMHVIGFVCERSFVPGEIEKMAFYCRNRVLFENEPAEPAALAL